MGLNNLSLDCDCCGVPFMIRTVRASHYKEFAGGYTLDSSGWDSFAGDLWTQWTGASYTSPGNWFSISAHKTNSLYGISAYRRGRNALYGYWPTAGYNYAPHGVAHTSTLNYDYSAPTADSCMSSAVGIIDKWRGWLSSVVWLFMISVNSGESLQSQYGITKIDLTLKFSVHMDPAYASDDVLYSNQVFKDKTLKWATQGSTSPFLWEQTQVDNMIEDIKIATGTAAGTFTLDNYGGAYLSANTSSTTYKTMQQVLASSYTEQATVTLDRDGAVTTAVSVTTGFDTVMPAGHNAFFMMVKALDPIIWGSNPLTGKWPGIPPGTWLSKYYNVFGDRISCSIVYAADAKNAGDNVVLTLVPSPEDGLGHPP